MKPERGDSLDRFDPVYDVEDAPLVPPTGAPQFSNKGHLSSLQTDDGLERKEFKGAWYNCFGDCSLMDWLACCLVLNVPCLAWSWNQMRAFQMVWWKECAKYIAAAVGVAVLYHLSIFLLQSNVVPSESASGEPELRQPSDEEAFVAALLLLTSGIGWLCIVMWLAYRRGMLRSRFNINGSRCGDNCLWLCCSSCALCQETRTLMHNRVEEGIWHGPPRMGDM